MARARSKNSANSSADLGFEVKLWLAADKLRSNMEAGEYKHVVLGLIFLKYISDTFEEHHAKLVAAKGEYAGANAEDPDEDKAENVFWVPPAARWTYLQNSAKQRRRICPPRKRPSQDQSLGEAHPPQTRLPARLGRRGDQDRSRPSRTSLRWLGGVTSYINRTYTAGCSGRRLGLYFLNASSETRLVKPVESVAAAAGNCEARCGARSRLLRTSRVSVRGEQTSYAAICSAATAVGVVGGRDDFVLR
jgi:hypothetical protein